MLSFYKNNGKRKGRMQRAAFEMNLFLSTPIMVHRCIVNLLVKLIRMSIKESNLKTKDQNEINMKKNKTIYWITTTIIGLIMLFSMYKMYTPDYDRMGLPNYLRIELSVFKIIGLIVLFLPQFSARVKEWAYAGFGITLVSAIVAHYSSGDALARSLEPVFFLVILAVSNVYMHKLNEQVS
jgi:uncharacterized membrane protein YhaH (DUF805 family)